MNFAQATFVKDLIWFDGPLLSHYCLHDQQYLAVWVDVTLDHSLKYELDTWLVVQVSFTDLEDYLTQRISMLEVERRSPAIYLMHGGFLGEDKELPQILFQAIPTDWRPTEESFLDDSIRYWSEG